jgi:hypothetical protein
MALINNKLRFDPDHTAVAGYYVCDLCEGRAPVGSEVQHKGECKSVGIAGRTLCFGPKQVQIVKDMAQSWGEEHTWYGLSLRHLKTSFPELLG